MFYRFKTSCLQSTVALIQALKQSAKEVSFAEFSQHVIGLEEWAHDHGYVGVTKDTYIDGKQGQGGLTLEDDFMVSYFQGVYNYHLAYFLVHSRIEYIWTSKRVSSYGYCWNCLDASNLHLTKEGWECACGAASKIPHQICPDHGPDCWSHPCLAQCLMCGARAKALGSLGSVEHFRCKDCGIDFSSEGA